MSKRNICFAAVAAFFIIIAVSVTLFAVLNRRAGIPDGSGDVSESGEPAGDISDIKVKHVFDRNLRGIWIASVYNIDYPSGKGLDSETLKAELDDIIETASAAGLNAVFFKVRPSSDALYASDIFPTSSYLVKNQGDSLPDGFDPLLYLINRAHSENISVHAWVNPVRVTAGSRNIRRPTSYLFRKITLPGSIRNGLLHTTKHVCIITSEFPPQDSSLRTE